MTEFWKRASTAIFFVIIMIACIAWNIYSFSLIMMICMCGVLYEYNGLARKAVKWTNPNSDITFTLNGLLIFAFTASAVIGWIDYDQLYLSVIFVILPIPLHFNSAQSQRFKMISYQIIGLLYICTPFILSLFLVYSDGVFDPGIMLGIIFLVWMSDTGAYIVGSLFGKNKLIERISPKKTWEGLIGGAVITVLVGIVISMFFEQLTLKQWIIVAGLVIIFGTIGDLLQSAIKRSVDVKDSGSILPGHGGFYDRFDALILVIPVTFIFIKMFI